MKKKIKTLQDAMSYQLQGMLYAEDKVSHEFDLCRQHITSTEVVKVIQACLSNSEDMKLKLARVFNYLLVEPVKRRNHVVDKMIDETHAMMGYTSSAHLKNVLMVGCLKNINAYKTACYQTSYLMASELEMDTAADLIQQVLEWEVSVCKTLSGLAIHEFNALAPK